MAGLKFSSKGVAAEAAKNILKAYLLANGCDDLTATMFGAFLSETIKGFSIEKEQAVFDGIDAAIKDAWVDVLSMEEFECLGEECKTDLKQKIISSQNVFEVLSADNPESELRKRIIAALKPYTDCNAVDLNEYARYATGKMLDAINKEIESDGILTLLKEIKKLQKDGRDRTDTLEDVFFELFNQILKRLDEIKENLFLTGEKTVEQLSVPERFWNAGKAWYEDSRRPGARFHSLDIVDYILPSATDRLEDPAGYEYSFSFKASDTDGNMIQCSRFSDLLRDKNSEYHQGHFMLVGEGGIGKTTTLMSVMYDGYDKKESYNGEPVIPLFVELSLSPDSQDSPAYDGTSSTVIHRLIYAMLLQKDSTMDHDDLMRECMNDESNIAKYKVRELLSSENGEGTRYALLLDGLNEVSAEPFENKSSSAQRRVLEEILEISSEYPDVTVILTGRNSVLAGNQSFHSFYLRGLEWDEIKRYLREKNRTDREISLIKEGDKGFLRVLSIPMFLTMYACLSATEGVTTRGELMKVFFHERSKDRKGEFVILRQGDIAGRIDRDEEQSVKGTMRRRKITLPMQLMFLDILIPEIAAAMVDSQSFRIYGDDVSNNLQTLFTAPNSLYCGHYKKYADPCFKHRLQDNTPKSIISKYIKAYDQDADVYGPSFLRYCESSLGIMYREGDAYGFVHQHFRDYFAAICIINRMKTACRAFQRNDLKAAREIMQPLDEKPISPLLAVYIGEYLGEHHNAPDHQEAADISAVHDTDEEIQNERRLVSDLLNVYRRMDQKCGYGVYNLVEILKRVKKDLSGSDFHELDLRRCRFHNVPLDSVQGTKFTGTVISGGNWFAEGHSGWVESVKFSQDGNLVVTASFDRTARIWDSWTGKLLYTLEGHSDGVNSAVFSEDGNLVVTASSDGTACIWDSRTGNLLHTLEGHSDEVNAAVFSPNGSFVATASRDSTARIWDSRTGSLLHTLEGHFRYVNSAVFSQDGNFVVTASGDGTARIWDSRTGRQLYILTKHCDAVSSAVFSGDGNYVFTTSGAIANIWDSHNGNLLHTLDRQSDKNSYAFFSEDGNLVVTASSDGTARIWDSWTGNQLNTLEEQPKHVVSAVFSRDEKILITVAFDGTAHIWDSRTGRLLYTLDGDSYMVDSAVFSEDGNFIATASSDGTARIWDSRTGSLLHTLENHSDRMRSATFSEDGSLVFTVSDNAARVWDSRTSSILHTFKGDFKENNIAVLSQDGNLVATASRNEPTRIWDSRTGNLLHTLERNSKWMQTVAFSGDGSLVVTASGNGPACIWDSRTGGLLHTLEGHFSIINFAVISEDGSLVVTSSFDGTARIWDSRTGNLLHMLEGYPRILRSATISKDGSFVATAYSDGLACIWDSRTGNLLHKLERHSDTVTSVTFSEDGSLVATAYSDGPACIWDSRTGSLLHTLEEYSGWVDSALFNRDGNLVVTACGDGMARIWDSRSGKLLHKLEGQSKVVRSAAFNKNGSLVVTASLDGTACIWDTRTGNMIKTLYEVSDLYISGVNFSDINPRSIITEKQKEIFHQYGAIV